MPGHAACAAPGGAVPGVRPAASHRVYGKGGPEPSRGRAGDGLCPGDSSSCHSICSCPETWPEPRQPQPASFWIWGFGMGLASPGSGSGHSGGFHLDLLLQERLVLGTPSPSPRERQRDVGKGPGQHLPHGVGSQLHSCTPWGLPGAILRPTASWICGAGQGWPPPPPRLIPARLCPCSAPVGGMERGCGAAAQGGGLQHGVPHKPQLSLSPCPSARLGGD